jgi:hypothetical protein
LPATRFFSVAGMVLPIRTQSNNCAKALSATLAPNLHVTASPRREPHQPQDAGQTVLAAVPDWTASLLHVGFGQRKTSSAST